MQYMFSEPYVSNVAVQIGHVCSSTCAVYFRSYVYFLRHSHCCNIQTEFLSLFALSTSNGRLLCSHWPTNSTLLVTVIGLYRQVMMRRI